MAAAAVKRASTSRPLAAHASATASSMSAGGSPIRQKFRGSATRLISTYTCPWAKIPSRQPSTFSGMVSDWTLCKTSPYAGPTGSCTMVASCGALSMRAVTSTQSTTGSRTRCCTEDS